MSKRIMSNSIDQTRIMLGNLPPGSVVLDRFGHAWQNARRYVLGKEYATGYWYRAYDGDDASEVPTWDLAPLGPFKLMVEK